MSASSGTFNPQLVSAPGEDRIEIPMKWRVGQIVLTLLVVALAIYYYTIGWKSPAGEVEVNRPTLWDGFGFVVLAGFIWLTTPTAGVIALTTFQEALRRRWMTALLAFGLVIVALSSFFTWMQPGEEQKFLRDFGLGFINILTILMAIFLGVALVPPEIERRTIFTILSKPVTRQEFLIGKFLGLCWTLFVNLALMGLMFLISYAIFKIRIEKGFAAAMLVDVEGAHPGLMFDLGNMTRALLLHMGQLSVLAALSLMLSLIVSHITAIVFCFVIFFAGNSSSYFEHLGGGADSHAEGEHKESEAAHVQGPLQGVVKAVYYLLPRLDRFDVRERLVTDSPVAFNYMWKAMGSGLTYVAVLLVIAYLVFSDREF
jgi:ABC-type transport system involved in multi-copper enzyme maturation permease subunit